MRTSNVDGTRSGRDQETSGGARGRPDGKVAFGNTPSESAIARVWAIHEVIGAMTGAEAIGG